MPTPLPSAVTDADTSALIALQDLQGYVAVNPAYSIEELTRLQDVVLRSAEATLRARKALAAARNAEIAAAREFHDAILGAKAAVIAQFGASSQAVQSIGLKKKSDRKRPTRRSPVESAG